MTIKQSRGVFKHFKSQAGTQSMESGTSTIHQGSKDPIMLTNTQPGIT